MSSTKKVLAIGSIAVALAIVGAAIVLTLKSPSTGRATDNSTTPLGGLFQRASHVSQLKKRMGELREVYPAMMNFAREHQDDLPRTVTELKPYLPAQLSDLNDEQWEIPAAGKWTPLARGEGAAAAVLFQQKNIPAGTARIVLLGDGHLEYKR